MQTRVRDGGAEIGIDDSGLDGRALIFDVDIEDAIHARKTVRMPPLRASAPPERPVPAPRPMSGV